MAGIMTEFRESSLELASLNTNVTVAPVLFGFDRATPVDVVAPFWARAGPEPPAGCGLLK